MLSALDAPAPGSGNSGEPNEEPDDRIIGGEMAGLIRRFRLVQRRYDHDAKLALLIMILRKTHDSLRRRHASDLLGAARLIFGTVEELAALSGKPWDPLRYYSDMGLPTLDYAAGWREPRRPANP